LSVSRKVETLAEYRSFSPSSLSFEPGASVPNMMSRLMRSNVEEPTVGGGLAMEEPDQTKVFL
jgi:hypothetical protein